MLKLLVFVLVLAAVFWGQRLISQAGKKAGTRKQGDRPAAAERMLACQRCGLHVPETEGVSLDGTFYCCEAHARGRDD